MSDLLKILMQRDGLSQIEAEDLIKEARRRVAQGDDPEELLYDEFGLEPDYVWDLL